MLILNRQLLAVDAIAGVIPVRIATNTNRKLLHRFYRNKRGNKMEYMIAFSVAAMMGLYVLILGHYLKDA